MWAPLFTASGNAIVTAMACQAVSTENVIFPLPAGTEVQMPALTAGTDYAVYLLPNGSLLASPNYSAPTGYSAAEVVQLGGAHYAPGGNAAAQAGGNSTPQFNPYSAWDIKFRPRCPNPRGMAFDHSGWNDIYLLNTTPDILGTSAYNAPIADGETPPLIPLAFGGNGTANYASLTQYEADEIFRAYGKRLPTKAELTTACFGVTEQTAAGTEPTVTALDAARTSKFGLMQATGNMWCWCSDLMFLPHTTTLVEDLAGCIAWIKASYDGSDKAITENRGREYTYGASGLAACRHGGLWFNGSGAGSRASIWFSSPGYSDGFFGARGRSDHMVLP